MTSCFVYKVIRDLLSIDHLCINPIRRITSSGCARNYRITRDKVEGAQWLSGRVLDSRPRAADSSLKGVTALWFLSKAYLS